MSKYLYVNGCSFTAGHELPLEDTWPYKLGELFKVRNVINKAVNGNSMFTIAHSTFHHLQSLPPEETTVVIGMTWEERYGFLFDNTSVNITVNDYDNPDNRDKKIFLDKIHKTRRITVPWDLDLNKKIQREFLDRTEPAYGGDPTNFNKVCELYTNYKKEVIARDPHLIRNIQLEYKYHLTMLETYLKTKGYKYLFVDFQKYYYPENFVSFDFTENNTGHPTAEDCTMYANFIYNKLTNE